MNQDNCVYTIFVVVVASIFSGMCFGAGLTLDPKDFGKSKGPEFSVPDNPDSDHHRYALILGVGDYTNSEFESLSYTLNDANAFRDVIGKLGHQVVDTGFLTDSDVTRTNVKRSLGVIGRLIDERQSEESTVLVYFSGHGYNKGGENYLVLGRSNESDLERTGIAFNELLAWLQETKAKNVVFIADACRNAGGTEVAGPTSMQTWVDPKLNIQNLHILLGAKPNGFAYEKAELGNGHGVFTYYLLDAISWNMGNDHGLLDLASLYEIVHKRVVDYSGGEQTPFRAGEFSGKFFLGPECVECGFFRQTERPKSYSGEDVKTLELIGEQYLDLVYRDRLDDALYHFGGSQLQMLFESRERRARIREYSAKHARNEKQCVTSPVSFDQRFMSCISKETTIDYLLLGRTRRGWKIEQHVFMDYEDHRTCKTKRVRSNSPLDAAARMLVSSHHEFLNDVACSVGQTGKVDFLINQLAYYRFNTKPTPPKCNLFNGIVNCVAQGREPGTKFVASILYEKNLHQAVKIKSMQLQEAF